MYNLIGKNVIHLWSILWYFLEIGFIVLARSNEICLSKPVHLFQTHEISLPVRNNASSSPDKDTSLTNAL